MLLLHIVVAMADIQSIEACCLIFAFEGAQQQEEADPSIDEGPLLSLLSGTLPSVG